MDVSVGKKGSWLTVQPQDQNEIELVLIDGIGISFQPTTIRSHLAFLVNYSDFLARTRVETVFRPLSGLLDALEKDSK